MQVTKNNTRSNKGFTLVEMIGVLAIIATIAGALLPRVFQAITDSQVNSVAQSVRGLKGAVSEFYAENNSFPANDTALLAAGLLEKPFASPIGTGTYNTVTSDGLDLATLANITGANFDLSGDGTTTVETPIGADIVYVALANVNRADAEAINAVLDGDTLDDATDAGGVDGADELGRVIYNGSVAFPTTVFIYVAHR